MMKNKLFFILFAFPVTSGLCAATLRSNIIKISAEEVSSLSHVMHGLTAVCVIAFLMALIAAFVLKDGVTFSSSFPSRTLPSFLSITAAIILIYAFLTLLPLRYEFDAARLILALLSVYCSVALLVLGKYKFAMRDDTSYCIFSSVPVFWVCFVIILAFRSKVSDPVISNYAFLMLSYISILFFCYSITAHILGKKKKGVAVFSCFIGIFFILTELFSLLFAGKYATLSLDEIRNLLPLFAFLITMPVATAEILKKNN